jgi:ZIP family zinc transporter
MSAIIFSIFAFISILLGGILGIKFRDKLHFIISFTSGVILAVVFFNILPEIFEITQENNWLIIVPMISLMVGFLGIHILEKTAVLHHSHEEEYADHKHPLVGVVSAIGLIIHSFLDGVGIGLGFQVDYRLGILIAVAVLAHGLCDGLNSVSLMLINKNSLKKSWGMLLIHSLAPVLGVASTFIFSISSKFLILYLGFFAGILLYIAAADLLPEAHSKHSSYKLFGLTILGAVLIFIVTRFV